MTYGQHADTFLGPLQKKNHLLMSMNRSHQANSLSLSYKSSRILGLFVCSAHISEKQIQFIVLNSHFLNTQSAVYNARSADCPK